MDHKDVQSRNTEAAYYRDAQPTSPEGGFVSSLRRISWSSVFAGVLIAIVIQIVLSLLGIGIGLSTIDPKTETDPANGLGTGSAIWYVVSSLVSLFAGGWIAGRLAQTRRSFDGAIHGLLTWSLITLATLYLLTSTIGSLLGGAGKLIGNTLGAAGNIASKGIEAAAPAVGDKLKDEGINLDDLTAQAKTLLSQTGKPGLQPGALSNQVDAAGKTISNTTDNVGNNPQQADNDITSLFNKLKQQGTGVVSQVDKDAMVNVIMARTGKSRDEATQVADNWIATYKQSAAKWEQTKQEAAAKARDIADKAAKAASTAAILAFFSFLLGAVVSAYGAKKGTDSKDNEVNRLQPVAVPV